MARRFSSSLGFISVPQVRIHLAMVLLCLLLGSMDAVVFLLRLHRVVMVLLVLVQVDLLPIPDQLLLHCRLFFFSV